MSSVLAVLHRHSSDTTEYNDVMFDVPVGLKRVEAYELLGSLLYCTDGTAQIDDLTPHTFMLFSPFIVPIPRRSTIRLEGELGFYYEFIRERSANAELWSIILGMVSCYGLAYPDRCRPEVARQLNDADPSRHW